MKVPSVARLRVDLSNTTQRKECEGLVEKVSEHVMREFGLKCASVSISLVGKSLMRRLNREYKDHDYDTDVLSFPIEGDLNEPSSGEERILGEIIISLDTTAGNARRFKTSFDEELALYVIHGLLHLFGFEDTYEPARTKMFDKQSQIFDKIKKEKIV